MMEVRGRVVKALVLAICKVSNSAFLVRLFTLKEFLPFTLSMYSIMAGTFDKTPTELISPTV